MSELILLKTYYHKHDAEIAIGLLKNAGIEAILQSDDAGGFRQHLTLGMGNNRVLIQEKDSEKALEIIKSLDETFSEEELKEIEEIAVNEKFEADSDSTKKSKRDYVIFIPIAFVVFFIVSYVLQQIPTNKYYSSNFYCRPVNSGAKTYNVSQEYYNDKNVRWIGHYKGDKAEGISKEFYSNGQLRWESMYVNNHLQGLFKSYYENGQVMAEGTFVNNKLEGQQNEYYKTGEIMAISHFKNDELHGNLKTFYKSGKLMEVLELKEGRRFNSDGTPYEGIEKTFYENGNLWKEWNYKDGRLDGVYKAYYEDGTLESELKYKKGKLYGEGKYYYENGQVHLVSNYDKDIALSAKEYDREGNLIFQGVYR